ncbi:MAG: hypothetical protein PVI07_06760 [Anaerolineae bacterium]
MERYRSEEVGEREIGSGAVQATGLHPIGIQNNDWAIAALRVVPATGVSIFAEIAARGKSRARRSCRVQHSEDLDRWDEARL